MMNATDIQQYLSELGELISQQVELLGSPQTPIPILLFGGAVMTNLLDLIAISPNILISISPWPSDISLRKSTEDIDFQFLFPQDQKYHPQMDAFFHASYLIRERHQLSCWWMNNYGASFLKPFLRMSVSAERWPIRHWKTFGTLQVFFPTIECQWALKIIAGRSKDGIDILTLSRILNLVSRGEAHALLDFFVSREAQCAADTDATIDRFFH